MNVQFSRFNLTIKLVNYRKFLAWSSIVCALLIAGGVYKLSFNSSYRVFFNPDNTHLRAMDQMNETFASEDNVIFVISTRSGDLFNLNDLTGIESLTKAAWLVPHSQHVDSLFNHPYIEGSGEGISARYLGSEEFPLTEENLAVIRDKTLTDKLALNRLVSADGQLMTVIVRVIPAPEDPDFTSAVIDYSNNLIAETTSHNPNLEIHLAGTVMVDYSILQATERDIVTLLPLLLVLSIGICFVITRSWQLMFASCSTIAVAVITTVGLAGWLGFQLNVVSTMSIFITVMLSLANLLHIGMHYVNQLSAGTSPEGALLSSIRHNGKAIVVMSITTMVGFLSINFLDASAYRELGILSNVGIVLSLIWSFTLFPALLVSICKSPPRRGMLNSWFPHTIADVSIRQRKPILIGAILVAIVTLPFIFQNRYNADPLNFFSEDMEFKQAVNKLSQHMPALNVVNYNFDTGEPDGVHDPAFLQQLDRFAHWLRQQPDVVHVYTYVDILKTLNQQMQGGTTDDYRLPDTKALASQYSVLYEFSLGEGQDTNDLLSPDRAKTKLVATIKPISNHDLLILDDRAYQWLQQHSPQLATHGVGFPTLFARQNSALFNSIGEGAVFTILAITSIILLSIRSVSFGLMSLVPNVIPPLIIYGLWGIFVGDVMESTLIAFSISMGIIIDDTVHILVKYLQARKAGLAPEPAARQTIQNNALALITTTVTIGTGLLVLASSNFEPNANLGKIMAPMVFLALLFDLLVLPGLLLQVDKMNVEALSTSAESDHGQSSTG